MNTCPTLYLANIQKNDSHYVERVGSELGYISR